MRNILKKNSNGFNYRYTDLVEIHRCLEEVGLTYYQEVETENGHDYIITHILNDADKEIRKCRGCRVPPLPDGKNAAQSYGSALTYARRYSLLLAFGLCTSDDDGAALTSEKPEKKVCKSARKPMDKPQASKSEDKPYRQAGIDAIKHLLNTGVLELDDVKAEVRKYGFDKIQDLPADSFVKCVAALTKGQGVI